MHTAQHARRYVVVTKAAAQANVVLLVLDFVFQWIVQLLYECQ